MVLDIPNAFESLSKTNGIEIIIMLLLFLTPAVICTLYNIERFIMGN